ncbi:MAG TPA: response regulator transcription factor [Thermomicrobiales bacterium]|nr:DNA-binding response regulator [Chloroflexota bacterium]HBY44859.1 DNA-binding response regulator [Chloroflexota bacterium]HCG29994.1 DNA-binding response regulator [Chloroflexota bacterium]HQZ90375.1 response regulator transcription factor [Thermomicrobiales bacterium]HRA31426.1 response regulator transcription factor [Thermomicrobiales bacterium]
MRVLIADDHALFRDGLRSLLEARGIDVVAEAKNGREAVELARSEQPEIVLMDLAMPEAGGLAATRIISADLPDVRVVVLTASEDDADLFEAIKSGAQGFLPKDIEAQRLFELLDGVIRGEPALTPGLARKLLDEFAQPDTPRPERPSTQLTDRERDVLKLLVQGITSNRELAERLVISENTVKYHLRNILAKLHLENRAQVVAYALRHQLVSPPDLDSN